mgnify:CR=1 FL=1
MGQAVGKAALRTAWYNVVGSFPLQKGGNHERNGASCIDGASSHHVHRAPRPGGAHPRRARGSVLSCTRFNLYREASRKPASTRWPHPSRAASRSRPSTSCRTCTCRPSWPWRIIRFYAHPGSMPSPRRAPRERPQSGRHRGRRQHHHPAAGEEPVLHPRADRRAQDSRSVHGADDGAALLEAHYPGAIRELHLLRRRLRGIGSASWGYFGKAPSALDADECTLLAGIPNAPSVYALSQNPGLARERQQEVLRKLVSYDYLGQDAAQHILGNLRALAA